MERNIYICSYHRVVCVYWSESQHYQSSKNSYFFLLWINWKYCNQRKIEYSFCSPTISRNNNGYAWNIAIVWFQINEIIPTAKQGWRKGNIILLLALFFVRQYCVNSSISIRFVVFLSFHFGFILFFHAFEFWIVQSGSHMNENIFHWSQQ